MLVNKNRRGRFIFESAIVILHDNNNNNKKKHLLCVYMFHQENLRRAELDWRTDGGGARTEWLSPLNWSKASPFSIMKYFSFFGDSSRVTRIVYTIQPSYISLCTGYSVRVGIYRYWKKKGGSQTNKGSHERSFSCAERVGSVLIYVYGVVLKDGFVKKIRSFFFYDNDVCVRTREYLPKERRKKKRGEKNS